MWCGVVSQCPVSEGDSVTVGCYAQYDWLSHLLHYNPIVALNASIQFEGHPGTLRVPPQPQVPSPRPAHGPPSEILTTIYHIPVAKPGVPPELTCRADFMFDRSTAYSGRNVYAVNPLEWTCTLRHELAVSCEYLCFLTRDAMHSAVLVIVNLFVCLSLYMCLSHS